MMNAELVAGGQSKVIIPTVYRDDYMGVLKKLTQQRNADPYIRMLERAHEFSENVYGEDMDEMQHYVEDTINLNAGDSIFILVNARTTSTTSQTFQINCAIPFACTSISTIPSCGTPVTFSPASGLLGDPNYPATTVCGGTTTQGGLENIYKFIAPSSGTYQFNVTSVANSNSVEYGYKTSAPCNWTGWNCLGAMTAVGQIDTINLNAGDSIFILVNARTTSTTNQTFQINCGTTGIIYNQTQPHLFSLYPNPFSYETTLQATENFKNATLTVYNSFGQLVKQIKNISGQTITLHRDNLSSGLYFIRLTQDNKVITKLVITD